MSIIEKISMLHQKAWRNNDDFMDSLEKAASICRAEYENGELSPLFINNYAAILLDLHRDNEALSLLNILKPDFSEYCSNLAIAIAKSAYNLELIRKWNQAAAIKPKKKDAIVAYMDWQGL